jgi:hypothetical protein
MTKSEMELENNELKLEIAKAHEALTELKAYLQSPKFYRDTTVQTSDILRRLDEVRLTPERVRKYAYHEVVGEIDGEDEVLFGSYDKSDCIYEKGSESPLWKDEGYRKIRLTQRLVEDPADPEIYG